jgi:hypothetical protein
VQSNVPVELQEFSEQPFRQLVANHARGIKRPSTDRSTVIFAELSFGFT